MKGITKRQKEVLDFIQQFISLYGYSPSYREVMHHFGFRSLATVSRYIHLLQKKEQLVFEKQSSRSVHPIKKEETKESILAAEVQLPFIGCLTFGSSLEIFAQPQSIAVPRSLISNLEHSYVIRARGEGFGEALIYDGDLLIVEGRQTANSGDVVIAALDRKETYIKKYYAEGQYIRLESLSMKLPPLIVPCEEVLIQGIVCSLFRLF